MKYTSFLILVLVSALYFISTVNGQKFADIVQKCKTGENATEEDFANLKKNVKPKTKAMKCLGACISENSGVYRHRGRYKIVYFITSTISNKKLSPEGTLAYVKTLEIKNDKLEQSVKEVLEECKAIQDADRCEFGSKLMDCLTDGAGKRGIKSLYPQ